MPSWLCSRKGTRRLVADNSSCACRPRLATVARDTWGTRPRPAYRLWTPLGSFRAACSRPMHNSLAPRPRLVSRTRHILVGTVLFWRRRWDAHELSCMLPRSGRGSLRCFDKDLFVWVCRRRADSSCRRRTDPSRELAPCTQFCSPQSALVSTFRNVFERTLRAGRAGRTLTPGGSRF